ncbi:MAG: hypothetical protein JO180_09595 [Gemmatirosa sp.]|nr:hypothetical protein [Gemmatirosa sp.]
MRERGAPRFGDRPTLERLRVRLTVWYVATLFVVLVALGGGLFAVISRQFALDLDTSLAAATAELIRAAHIREQESAASGPVVDAIDELRIPDRTLYLLDVRGGPVKPAHIEGWIRATAVRAAAAGRLEEERELPTGRQLRLHAERFALRDGTPLVAMAVADNIELEDRFAALIAAFGGAAVAAIVLVAAAGWLLVRQSTAPVERGIAHMRRFMADAAHELRTPVSVLRSQAEVALLQPRAPASYVDTLRRIAAESDRLGRIVEGLLTLARADAGERPIDHRRVYLDDVIVDAAGAAQPLALRRGVALAVADFEEAPVDGDEALLRQLVMILLDNGLKYTPVGGTVRVGVQAQDGQCVLRVEDTGVGIAPEQLPHVFERFWRGDLARTRGDASAAAPDGAGLGLAIAQWIVGAHDADIDVASEPGRGTTVTVRFPAAGAASEGAAAD